MTLTDLINFFDKIKYYYNLIDEEIYSDVYCVIDEITILSNDWRITIYCYDCIKQFDLATINETALCDYIRSTVFSYRLYKHNKLIQNPRRKKS